MILSGAQCNWIAHYFQSHLLAAMVYCSLSISSNYSLSTAKKSIENHITWEGKKFGSCATIYQFVCEYHSLDARWYYHLTHPPLGIRRTYILSKSHVSIWVMVFILSTICSINRMHQQDSKKIEREREGEREKKLCCLNQKP